MENSLNVTKYRKDPDFVALVEFLRARLILKEFSPNELLLACRIAVLAFLKRPISVH